ncbi:MYND-type domain-containing protein [Mycena kentingensis (nom. inval.)]|nr:MYND-type domain-containing protein [Mycena kentingensis (nom. inval.)]
MHDSLKLSVLNHLPTEIRKCAKELCAGDVSLPMLHQVIDFLDADEANATKILPVLYSTLDEAHVPTAAAPEESDATRLAWTTLDAMRDHGLHRGRLANAIRVASGDFTPRVVAWLRFFEAHPEAIPAGGQASSKNRVYELLLGILHSLTLPSATGRRQPLNAVAGAIELVVRAWKYVLSDEFLAERKAQALIDPSYLLGVNHTPIPDVAAELIAGAGGTQEQLAELFVAQLRYTAPLLADSEVAPEVRSKLKVIATSPILFLAPSSSALSRSFNAILEPCLRVLAKLILPPSPYAVDAFRHKLLHTVINVGTAAPSRGIKQLLFALLGLALPMSLMQTSVLQAGREILEEVRGLAEAPAFKQCETYALWKPFEDAFVDRLELFERYNAGEFPAMKMCNHVKCNAVGPESAYKRCSGCRVQVYCSEACQKADWRGSSYLGSSGHKKGCAAFRQLHQHELSLGLSPADRDFLRVTLDHDHATHVRANGRSSNPACWTTHGWNGTAFNATVSNLPNVGLVDVVGSEAAALEVVNRAGAYIIEAATGNAEARMMVDLATLPGKKGIRYLLVPRWVKLGSNGEVEMEFH